MVSSALPDGFDDLEKFAPHWDLPGTNARYDKRLSSDYADLEDFHGAVKGRLEAIKTYLDGKDFDDYSDADRRLARLVFAWVPIAEAVEVFKQPRVPDSKMYWDVQVEPDL